MSTNVCGSLAKWGGTKLAFYKGNYCDSWYLLQIKLVNLESTTEVLNSSRKTLLRQSLGLKATMHQSFSISMDPIYDTPMDLLHNIPLGVVKHLWDATLSELGELQKQKVQYYVRNFKDWHLLKIRKLNYNILKNFKSFQGSEFIALLKILPLALRYALNTYDRGGRPVTHHAESSIIDLWINLNDIYYFLNQDSIVKIELDFWEAKIKTVVENMYKFSNVLKNRSKLHHLIHFMEDLKRFGTVIGSDCKVWESMNKITRAYIQGSNNTNDSLAALAGWKRNSTAIHLMNNGHIPDFSKDTIAIQLPGIFYKEMY